MDPLARTSPEQFCRNILGSASTNMPACYTYSSNGNDPVQAAECSKAFQGKIMKDKAELEEKLTTLRRKKG